MPEIHLCITPFDTEKLENYSAFDYISIVDLYDLIIFMNVQNIRWNKEMVVCSVLNDKLLYTSVKRLTERWAYYIYYENGSQTSNLRTL